MAMNQLAKSRLVPAGSAGHGESPRGIVVTREDIAGESVLNVAIKAPRYPLWLSGLVIGVPLLWIVVGLTVTDGLFVAMFAIAFLLLAGLVFVPDWRTGREIEVSDSYITVIDPLHRNLPQSVTMKIDEIEQIVIATAHARIGNELVIVGDDERVPVGRGLPMASLQWLQSFLIAAVSRG